MKKYIVIILVITIISIGAAFYYKQKSWVYIESKGNVGAGTNLEIKIRTGLIHSQNRVIKNDGLALTFGGGYSIFLKLINGTWHLIIKDPKGLDVYNTEYQNIKLGRIF